jgi:hypothetical protein
MAGIVFWFENFDKDVFSSRHPVDLDAWRYAAKAGDIHNMHCINTSSTFSDSQLQLGGTGTNTFSETFEDWYATHSTENIVILETQWTAPPGSIALKDLDHSNVDWYVFGSSSGAPIGLPHQYVYLPQNGVAALHSAHIASAVMLRRFEALN